jgi:hypothetical protein
MPRDLRLSWYWAHAYVSTDASSERSCDLKGMNTMSSLFQAVCICWENSVALKWLVLYPQNLYYEKISTSPSKWAPHLRSPIRPRKTDGITTQLGKKPQQCSSTTPTPSASKSHTPKPILSISGSSSHPWNSLSQVRERCWNSEHGIKKLLREWENNPRCDWDACAIKGMAVQADDCDEWADCRSEGESWSYLRS